MGLKVGFITPYRVRCGISSYSQNLIDALVEQDVEVYVVRLPRFGAKTRELVTLVAEKGAKAGVAIFHNQHEYGLFQNLEEYFYSALKALKKPIVTTMHSVGNWQVDKIIDKFSDKVIVHNDFCKRRYMYKSIIIPHGAKPVECPPRDVCRKEWKVHPLDAPIIGYLGFISPYKGLESLIEAASKAKVGLLIGGGWHTAEETVYMEQLKQLTEKLMPKTCKWLGHIPDDKLASFYGTLDAVIYPSRFATESGALITALSHGKAVISRNLAPFKEKEKLGALVTFKDVKDLTRKIKRLLKDEETRRKLEEGAKAFARKNSWEVVAEKHVGLYEDVIKHGVT